MRKLLNELPMIGFGTGLALTGVSLAAIGVHGVKRNFYVAGMVMGGGVWLAHFGSLVAVGSIERVRGLR